MPEGAPEAWAEEFQHEARFYSGLDEFLAATVPFLLEGLERGEPMFVAALPPQLDALRAALPDGGAGVALDDMRELGRNPAHLIPAWNDFFHRNGAGARPVRGVGELIWPGRSHAELAECRRHEALVNVAFAHAGPWQLVCTYDIDALPTAVNDDAERTHPWVSDGAGARRRNHCCESLGTMAGRFDAPLPPAPDGVASLPFGVDAVALVREYSGHMARAFGLHDVRADDIVLAVHELASNSVRHAGGHGVLRLWRDENRVVCEVADHGHIDLPLVGRQRPEPDRIGGRGLWMANQLCDLVQIRTTSDRNVVRLHQRVD